VTHGINGFNFFHKDDLLRTREALKKAAHLPILRLLKKGKLTTKLISMLHLFKTEGLQISPKDPVRQLFALGEGILAFKNTLDHLRSVTFII